MRKTNSRLANAAIRLHRAISAVERLEQRTLLAGSIEGMVWRDLNTNGLYNAGEETKAGWTVYLDQNRNRALDTGEARTLTDAAGRYRFSGLAGKSYYVAEQPPAGWVQPYSGSDGIILNVQLRTGDVQSAMTYTGSTSKTRSLGEINNQGGLGIETVESTPLIRLDDFRGDYRFSSVTGTGYSVVILDTGIDVNHPFFGADLDANGIADRIVYQYDYVNNDGDATDGNGHGSNVASISASSDGTYTGMAPGANIIAMKVLSDSGSGQFSYLESALQWVVANAETYNIAAINMSLGDSGNYNTSQALYGLNDEMAALVAKNVIVVSAAGNGYYAAQSQGVSYPAADANSLAVGAVYDANVGSKSYSSGAIDYTTGPDRITSFSQRSTTMVDIFAPGAVITGASYNGSTVSYTGTSQASPHIAGIAVLAQQLAMECMGRRLTQAEFASLMRSSGVTIYDGDNEDDNVTNTNTNYQRVDVMALAESIWGLGFRGVVAQTPSGISTTPISQLDLTFSEAMDPTSFSIASDVNYFTGPGGADLKSAITGYSWINGNRTLRLTFPAQSTNGSYELSVGPQILMGSDGTAMDQDGDRVPGEASDTYVAQLHYDAIVGAVIATVPADGSAVTLPLTTIDLIFNEPFDPASLAASDLSISRGTVTGVTAINPTTARFSLSGITGEGTLSVSMAAGAVTDVSGFSMAAYSGSLFLDVGTVPLPTPLNQVAPSGSMIYTGSTTGTLAVPTDSDGFTLSLDAGQVLSVLVDPAGTLRPTIEVRGPGGVLLGSGASPAAGEPAILQNIAVSTAGTYTIVVGSAAGTSGSFTVQAILNSALEEESYDGPSNDLFPGAQDLDPGFIPLTDIADRGSVLGSLPGSSGTVVASESFESGSLGPSWSVYSSTSFGRNVVTSAQGAAAGTFALVMDTNDPLYGLNLNEAVWTVNLSGLTQATLEFWQEDYSDEMELMPVSFVGHYNADGVAISADGTNWYRVWTPSVSTLTFTRVSVDLAAAATAAGIPLGPNFKVKFQQYDNYPAPTDGRGWDGIAITTPSLPGPDNYSVSLSADQVVSVSATRTDGTGTATVRLYDGSGNLLATGTSGAANVMSAISGFVAPSTGTYYVQVSGSDCSYSLVAVRGGIFDLEANNTISQAQAVSRNSVALGWLEAGASSIEPDDYAAGTALTNVVPGITLSAQGLSGTVRSQASTYHSTGTRVFALDTAPAWYSSSVWLRADFAGGVSSVSIDIIPDDSNDPGIMRAYNSLGVLLQEITCAAPALGSFSTITITRPTADIAYITAAGLNGETAMLDNLVVDGAGGGSDFYEISASAGETLTFRTYTPGDGAGEFANLLNPAIEIYDAGGTRVAFDDDGAPDSRNAMLAFVAPASGLYYARIHPSTSGGATGEYLLAFSSEALTVTAPASVGEGNAAVSGSVSVTTAPTSDLVVSLTSSDPARLSVPPTVTILAGQLTASFTFDVLDNALLDGLQQVSISAAASGYASMPAVVVVHDDETATLSVALPANAQEGDGTVTGTITASAAPARDTVIALTSSNPARATVPATVTLLAGQTSVTFSVSIVDNTVIDGTQAVTVTASVDNWTNGAAGIDVQDNDARITVTLAASGWEGQTLNGAVALGGTLATDLVVTLDSSDISELTAPLTVTIPAGQTSASFNITLPADALRDGTQTATLSATAAGMTPGSADLTIRDSDLDHLAFDTINGPKTAGVAFSATARAYNIVNELITVYAGTASLSASGLAGPLAATPSSVAFSSGVWTGNVTVNAVDSAVSLGVSAAGVTGTSNTFVVQAGALASFQWATIPSPQGANVPFAVTVTAKDANGFTASSFNGAATISGRTGTVVSDVLLGNVTYTNSANYGTYTLGYAFTPSTNIQVTHVRSYCGSKVSIWTNTGTLVASRTVSGPAMTWTETALTTPVDLAAGTTYRVAIYSAGQTYYWRNVVPPNPSFATIGSAYWISGDVFPTTSGTDYWLVDLRGNVGTGTAVSVFPTSVTFVNGVWSGNVTAAEIASGMSLQVNDGAGHSGASNTFDVLSTTATPSAPLLTAGSDTGISSSDGLTKLNNSSPATALTFTVGNTTAGATVELYVNNILIGSAVAVGTTTTVTTDGSTVLSNGSVNVVARQTLAGVPSGNSPATAITVDAIAPTVSVTTVNTTDTTPALSGSASESLGTAQVMVNGLNYTATVNAATWSLADNIITPALPYGTHNVTVTVTDRAGNSASDTTTNELTVVPATPTGVDLLAGSDTGNSSTDNLTKLNNSSPAAVLSFSVSNTIAGALVELLVSGNVIGSAVATGTTTTVVTNGTVTLADGARSIYARQSVGGIVSASSTSLSVTVDTAAPTVSVTNKTTSDPTPSLTGGIAGSGTGTSVRVTVNGNGYDATFGGSVWTISDNVLYALSVGTYDVAVAATDGAGNIGTDSTLDELEIIAGTGEIHGVTWNDANANQLRDVGEGAIPGVTVYLDMDRDGVLDVGEPQTTSAPDGSYAFTALGADTYQVRQVVPAGWEQTSPAAPTSPTVSLISVTSRRDLVFDDTRGLLYITTSTGDVMRYRLSDGSLLSTVDVATFLNGADITPDGGALYVADGSTYGTLGYVRKIDLDTLAVTGISYNLGFSDTDTWDVSIGASGLGLVVTEYSGSGWVYPRTLDTATDTLATRTDLSTIPEPSNLVRGFDRSTIFLAEGNNSAGRVHLYDVASDSFVRTLTTNTYLSSSTNAVNRNGTLMALDISTLRILDRNLATVRDLSNLSGGVVFSPTMDRLYAVRTTTNQLVTVDTNTWTELSAISIGETTTSSSPHGAGVMAISGNGRYIALSTTSGVRLIDLGSAGLFRTVVLSEGEVETDADFGSRIAKPNAPVLASASDSGISNTDRITNLNNATPATSLLFTVGNTLPGATVEIRVNGVLVGTTVASGATTDVTTDGLTVIPDGACTVVARQLVGGLPSGDSASLTITVDTTAPTAPTAPDLQSGSDSGVSATDNITRITTPAFTVAATPYYRFYADGAQISGDYQAGTSYTAGTQSDGTHGYTVRAVDVAGNVSVPGPVLNVTFDTVAPSSPVLPDLKTISDSGMSTSDDITNLNSLLKFELLGTEAGVLHLDADGVLGSGPSLAVVSPGAYELTTSSNGTPTNPGVTYTGSRDYIGTLLSLGIAADGSFVGPTIGARYNGVEYLRWGTYVGGFTVAYNGVNYKNNIGAGASGATAFPVTLEDFSSGALHGVRIRGLVGTSVQFLRTIWWTDGDAYAMVSTTLTNTSATSISSVALLDNQDPDPANNYTTVNDVIVNANGTFVVGSFTGTGAMALGSIDSRAVASVEASLIVTSPFDVINSPVDPNGASADYSLNIASNIGSLMAGQSVTTTFAMVYGSSAAAAQATYAGIAARTAPGGGTFSDGIHQFSAWAEDVAGNPSLVSPSLAVTVDTIAPSTPVAPDLKAASDSGISSIDNITNDSTPTFDVSAAPYFGFYRNGTLLSGSYETGTTYTVNSQADGTYSFALTALDVAGNASASSPATTVTIDTVAPTLSGAPDLQSASDSGISNSDDLTNITTPTLDVTVNEAGTITLIMDGDTLGARMVTAAGPGVIPVTVGQFGGPLQFQPSVAIPSSAAMAATMLDINNDGRPDVLLGTLNSGLGVMLGNGNGTFQSLVGYGANQMVESFALGDFDGDGRLDAATGNSAVSSIGILIGQTSGFAEPRPAIFTGASPTGVVAADFNGDGKLDIAAGYDNATRLDIMLGNGDGTFQSPTAVSLGSNGLVRQLATADVNGDGDPDLVASTVDTRVLVLLGSGGASFTSPVAYSVTRTAFALADLDGDADVDIAVASGQILLGAGNGTFTNGTTVAGIEQGMSVAVADLDGDSKSDLVFGSIPKRLYVVPGNGDGTFGAIAVDASLMWQPYAFAIGDFSGDGRRDIVSATGNTSSSELLVNTTPAVGGLADGLHSFSAYASDAAGNQSPLTSDILVTIDTAAPTILAVRPNGSDSQRSMVQQIEVDFGEAVSLSADALQLLLRSGSVPADTVIDVDNPWNDGRYVLTFSGSAVIGGSLADGMYSMEIEAAGVEDLAGNALVSDSTTRFHRLFGDFDGDRDVDNADLLRFRQAMNKPAMYDPMFDFNDDGVVNHTDYAQLKSRLVRSILM